LPSIATAAPEAGGANLGTMPDNLQRILIRVWHFIQAVWKQFKQDKVVIRSSGLAYSTLLAIVPLAAVLFALFTAFGALDDLKRSVQQLVVDRFLPTRQEELSVILDELIENAGTFGILGFALLAITALLLLNGIESNFNDIWHVQRRRRYLSKITAYTSVLVLGSLFLGASLSVSARIKALLFSGTILDRTLIRRTLDWSSGGALCLERWWRVSAGRWPRTSLPTRWVSRPGIRSSMARWRRSPSFSSGCMSPGSSCCWVW
jgi:uncharacterized BrkB/YihY/UPF0761 family membrane protein